MSFQHSDTVTKNSSEPESVQQEWNSSATMTTLCSFATFVVNLFVLIIFIKNSHLRNPFTMYLINLLVANLILSVGETVGILDDLHYHGFSGSFLCQLEKYTSYTSSAIVIHSHLLITVNRIWAISLPISYRNYHTKKFAAIICVTTICYVHILTLPIQILNFAYYRLPENAGCFMNLNELRLQYQIVHPIVFDFPVLFIISAFPYLYWKSRQRDKTAGFRNHQVLRSVLAAMRPASNVPNEIFRKSKPGSETNGHPLVVLGILTLSIFVCWIPSKILGVASNFTSVKLVIPPIVYSISDMMYSIQSVLDPLLFSATLKDLRIAIKRALVCSR